MKRAGSLQNSKDSVTEDIRVHAILSEFISLWYNIILFYLITAVSHILSARLNYEAAAVAMNTCHNTKTHRKRNSS